MEFHFPLSAGSNLVTFLQDEGYLAGSAETIALEGMMTGLIDLTFRHQDRYFVVDYKSNYLGYDFSRYSGDHLAGAMKSHQYDLQYLIYTLAVHKMLKQKLPGYEYARDFGGVYYLFLRGMRRDSGNGVYFARPEVSTIESLERLLAP